MRFVQDSCDAPILENFSCAIILDVNEINLVHFETGLGIIPNYEIFNWLSDEIGEGDVSWKWTREPFTISDDDSTIVGAFLFRNSNDALRFKLRWCDAE
jgi:hypothetical protein